MEEKGRYSVLGSQRDNILRQNSIERIFVEFRETDVHRDPPERIVESMKRRN